MNIPNFVDTKIIDQDGHLTDVGKQMFSQLFTELQLNLSQEGIKIPQQTSANVTTLNTAKSTGALLYDQDVDKMKANIAGTFRELLASHGNTTGSGTPQLGTNCPATTLTSPYTWVKVVSEDGTTCHMPAWK